MSRHILPEPPFELKQLSDELSARIHAEIQAAGMIPFSRFMEMALYEPGYGYYSAGLHKFGESGDFITAPEIGPLFATCLARQLAEVGQQLGSYDILEVGAGSGRLAADLLRDLDPAEAPGRYRILERSADLRQVQHQHIAAEAPAWVDRIEWLDRPPADQWQGLIIANEVIDALAVERFQWAAGEIQQLCIAECEGKLEWTQRPAPNELSAAVQHVAADIGPGFLQGLNGGYRSEINLHLPAWLAALSGSLSKGLALFIDYGYPRREYYLPERRDGTLMCHYRHRAHDDVFFWPGLQDITAWVDFTALAEAADQCSLEVEGYSSQAMFLLACGLDRVLQEKMADSPDGGVDLQDEVRQLTLPGMMGEKFQVMGLGRGLDQPLRGFSLQDLRYRL
jgi:SAM-dependent MidA family methyltransferase